MGPEKPDQPAQPVASGAGLPPAARGTAGAESVGGDPREPRGDARSVRDWLAMVLGALVFTFGLCLTTPPLFESVDFVLYHQPNFEYLRRAVGELRLPGWNPHIGLGRPFLADLQNAVFYPPAYLALCGSKSGPLLVVALHAVLALAGMRALGRALALSRPVTWGLGFSFLLSLPLSGRLMAGQLLYFGALCYLPVLFWFTLRLAQPGERRDLAGHALFLALQFLCGHPQVFWFSALGQLGFLNARLLADSAPGRARSWLRGNLRLAGAFVLCTGLVAVVLFPFLELVGQGNRTGGSKAFCDFGRLEWLDLMGLFGDPPYPQLLDWERNLFVGAPAVLGGLLGWLRWKDPDARALLIVGAVAVVLSVGAQTPAFDGFYQVLPGFSSFRVHARSAALLSFVLLLSAGLWLSRSGPSRPPWIPLIAVGGLLFLAVAIHRDRLSPVLGLPFSAWMLAGGLALLGLWQMSRSRRPSLQPWVLGALALLQAADLLNANLQFKGTYSFLNVQGTSPDFPFRRAVAAVVEEQRSARSDPWPPRVLVPRKLVPANFGMRDGYGNVDAYTSLFLKRPWQFLHTVLELPEPQLKNTSVAGEIYDRNPFGHPLLAVDLGWDGARRLCLTNREAAPRAFLAPGVTVETSLESLLGRLRRGHDGRSSVLVEGAAGAVPSDALANGGSVQTLSWSPERIEFAVQAPRATLLVLAEAWYPGWKARLGTRVIESIPANGWMRAFPVPAGDHRVEVYFQQHDLVPGLVVSLISAVALGVLRLPIRS